MKVSVLMASYNYARYVGDAVRSVLDQDYVGDIECIVVDDGSTDDTAAVLSPFADRIQYVYQDNRGQAAAFNTAFARSKGDVVCFLDADDAWLPQKVRRVVAAFEEHPEVGLVHHPLLILDADGVEVPFFQPQFQPAVGDVSLLMRRKVLPYPFWCTSGVSLRRSVCRYVFPLLENLKSGADGLIATSAALLAPVHHLDETLGTYLLHGKNVWAVDFMKRKAGGVSEVEEAERWVADLEEKVEQANQTLRRAGDRGDLTAWISWSYIKYRSILGRVDPLTFYPEILSALCRLRGFGPWAKIGIAGRLLRRSLKHRGRYTVPAPWGEG